MQRRVLGVGLQKLKGFVGLLRDGIRENVVAGPEIRRSVVDQMFVDFPAAWDSRALSAKRSSLPAFTSASN